MSHTRDALAPSLPTDAHKAPGLVARLRRVLTRSDPPQNRPHTIDWHGRYVDARADGELRRATAICRAALQREDCADWWLRLARCQAERDFFVDALDAVQTALDRAGPTGGVRDEACRLLAAARSAAGYEQGAAAQRLDAAIDRLEHRLAA